MAGPGDEKAAAAAGRGHLRASHADREQVIDVLKAAFVQGRLCAGYVPPGRSPETVDLRLLPTR